MIVTCPATKISYHLPRKCRLRLPLAKITESHRLYERLLPNFQKNMAMWPATKMSSAHLEYTADFNQTFNKIMQLGLASADRENVGQGHISQSNISA